MDESKKKEFERTIETYADSFLKADNPRLIYEIAYSLRRGFLFICTKSVSINNVSLSEKHLEMYV